MRNRKDIREKLLNQPSYWVEGINSFLYNAILDYMEAKDMNRTKMAEHLGISKGRVSQILNDGEINFSIEKVIQIALKVDKFPVFDFINKQEYLRELDKTRVLKEIEGNYENDNFSKVELGNKSKTKIIPLYARNEFNNEIAL